MIHRSAGKPSEAGRMVIRNSDDGKPYKIIVDSNTKVRAHEMPSWALKQNFHADYGSITAGSLNR